MRFVLQLFFAVVFLSAPADGGTADGNDCCLCDDDGCGSVSSDRNLNEDTLKMCQDVAFHLMFHVDPEDDECMLQKKKYLGICCNYSTNTDVSTEEGKLDPKAQEVRRLQFSWNFPSSPSNYQSWSNSVTNSLTNTLTQWLSSSNILTRPTTQWNNNGVLTRPQPSFSVPPPPPPTRPSFSFPRPAPRPSFSFFPPPPAPRPSFPSFPAPKPTAGFQFPGPSPSAPSPGPSSQAWVTAHNTRRQQYHRQNGVSFVPVKWSNELASSAHTYTQRLLNGLSGCQIRHGFQNDSYGGENLAMQSTSSTTSTSPETVLRMWYEGEIGLRYPANGHLTQVVWRATKYVGCASGTKRLSNGSTCHIQTCRYLAPGNCNGIGQILSATTPCGDSCPRREGCF